jgi:hypothetical protein
MLAVCAEKRVEHAVAITKNAAQASDSGVGQGTQRPLNFFEMRRWADAGVPRTISRARIFPACGTRFSKQMACIDTSAEQ